MTTAPSTESVQALLATFGSFTTYTKELAASVAVDTTSHKRIR